jgi:hypothetical protein
MAKLGDLVRDEVSGFTGLVLARHDGLYEASQCRVHSRRLTDQGDIRGGVWLEEDRLVVLEEAAVVGFKNIVGKPTLASDEAKA